MVRQKAQTNSSNEVATQSQNLIFVQQQKFVDTIQAFVSNTFSEDSLVFEEPRKQDLEQFWSVLTPFAEDVGIKVTSETPDQEIATNLFVKIYKSFDTHGSSDVKKKQKKIHITTKLIRKESLEKAVQFASKNVGQFNSRYVLYIYELLSQLSFVGKSYDLIELEVADNIIVKTLQRSGSDANTLFFQTLTLKWYMTLISHYRDFVFQYARRAYFDKVMEQRRKQAEKEQKEKKKSKIGASRHQEKTAEDIDPEEAMFGDDKQDEVPEDGQVDDTFDENAHDKIYKYKRRLISSSLFSATIRIAIESAQRLQKQENFDFFSLALVNGIVMESLNSSPAQDRFEQSVDLWWNANINDLFANIIRVDRLQYPQIVEMYLFLFNQMLNNVRVIEKTGPIINEIAKMLIITNDDYIFNGCCYALARTCCRSPKVAQQVVKSSGDNVVRTCIKACKKRTDKSRALILIPAYSAMNSLLQELTPEQILQLDREKEMNVVDMVVQDIKTTGTQNWDLRYSAMITLKVIGFKLQNTADAAPLYRRLLMSKILQTMTENLQRPQPKDPKKESEKDKRNRERDDSIHVRYTMPSSIAALNSVFHNAKKNNDPENIKIMKDLVQDDPKFQDMLQFLAFMESKKHEQLISAKTIGAVIAFFLLFLIALPFVFSHLKSLKER